MRLQRNMIRPAWENVLMLAPDSARQEGVSSTGFLRLLGYSEIGTEPPRRRCVVRPAREAGRIDSKPRLGVSLAEALFVLAYAPHDG